MDNLFQDDTDIDITDSPADTGPSPRVRKQIEKLMREDQAQKQRTWKYYEKMRQEKPDQYWKDKTQLQMHQDAIDLGEAFNDEDSDD